MIQLTAYKATDAYTHSVETVAELLTQLPTSEYNTWIHLEANPTQVDAELLVAHFGMDISVARLLAGDQQVYDDDECNVSVICKFDAQCLNPDTDQHEPTLFTFLIVRGALITSQSGGPDWFAHSRQMILKQKGRMREKGTDYLAYRLLKDGFIERYLNHFQQYHEQLEQVGDVIFEGRAKGVQDRLQAIRDEVKLFPEVVANLENVLEALDGEESGVIDHKAVRQIQRFSSRRLRDLKETIHLTQAQLGDLYHLYRNQLNESINLVMKCLTALSTVFLPLTFLTSFYGMNFRYMPELEAAWAYPATILALLLIGLGSLWYLRRNDMF